MAPNGFAPQVLAFTAFFVVIAKPGAVESRNHWNPHNENDVQHRPERPLHIGETASDLL